MEKIKAFFSKQGIGFYIGAAATLLMLISTILLATNCNMEYYKDYNPVIPALGCLAVIVAIALLTVKQFVKIPHLEAAWVVVVLLMGIAFMVIASMRVESLAYVLGSELESGNEAAQAAVSNFIAGAVITVISLITAVVASFFNVIKEN